jgi:N-acetyl-anhydromuramyl-L-alanine amidase AmpD
VSIDLVWAGARYVCTPAPDPEPDGAPWEDWRDKMPVNPTPDASALITKRGGWWQRALSDIDGITIHHTLSHDPIATASWIVKPKVQGGKGHATTQYHVWITKDGRALWCVGFEHGLWHDHCGDLNKHISIGLSGSLHVAKPPTAQLRKAAQVVAYLMARFDIRVANVAGHNDWAMKCSGVKTDCPGWDRAGWRSEFYAALDEWL